VCCKCGRAMSPEYFTQMCDACGKERGL
jgi:hypothetical protein